MLAKYTQSEKGNFFFQFKYNYAIVYYCYYFVKIAFKFGKKIVFIKLKLVNFSKKQLLFTVLLLFLCNKNFQNNIVLINVSKILKDIIKISIFLQLLFQNITIKNKRQQNKNTFFLRYYYYK
eukprot:TRINITY_DN6958_c0_g1_i3.p6 TRINITY_DN6958_c0_g1~~TRINITY_DN6958_c0_g1_i3.p6  ORF type:complete len:122 (-),score=1.70 TRINITY_DN6958_c0_g1_i3:203-568(-)